MACCCGQLDQMFRLLLVHLLHFLAGSDMSCSKRDLDVAEIFSGCGSLTAACNAAGLKAKGYDLHMGPQCDILSTQGFIEAAATLVLILKPTPAHLLLHALCLRPGKSRAAQNRGTAHDEGARRWITVGRMPVLNFCLGKFWNFEEIHKPANGRPPERWKLRALRVVQPHALRVRAGLLADRQGTHVECSVLGSGLHMRLLQTTQPRCPLAVQEMRSHRDSCYSLRLPLLVAAFGAWLICNGLMSLGKPLSIERLADRAAAATWRTQNTHIKVPSWPG